MKMQPEGGRLQARKRALQDPTPVAPGSWASSLQNCENKCLLFKPPSYAVLCLQPELTHSPPFLGTDVYSSL